MMKKLISLIFIMTLLFPVCGETRHNNKKTLKKQTNLNTVVAYSNNEIVAKKEDGLVKVQKWLDIVSSRINLNFSY